MSVHIPSNVALAFLGGVLIVALCEILKRLARERDRERAALLAAEDGRVWEGLRLDALAVWEEHFPPTDPDEDDGAWSEWGVACSWLWDRVYEALDGESEAA